eukprot:gnl/Dysnectes_brevis/3960_a5165_995.p1 GENE.gnl/Dysnectes_brevis/3960_a5165_995~~gnl/Dysnectes_brevis/3960_a5165_995.p1  ORF type:complete len:370 (+),score=67.09 gnl/Dysnectes_brevis/3960_a5165_995:40-1110(+)
MTFQFVRVDSSDLDHAATVIGCLSSDYTFDAADCFRVSSLSIGSIVTLGLCIWIFISIQSLSKEQTHAHQEILPAQTDCLIVGAILCILVCLHYTLFAMSGFSFFACLLVMLFLILQTRFIVLNTLNTTKAMPGLHRALTPIVTILISYSVILGLYYLLVFSKDSIDCKSGFWIIVSCSEVLLAAIYCVAGEVMISVFHSFVESDTLLHSIVFAIRVPMVCDIVSTVIPAALDIVEYGTDMECDVYFQNTWGNAVFNVIQRILTYFLPVWGLLLTSKDPLTVKSRRRSLVTRESSLIDPILSSPVPKRERKYVKRRYRRSRYGDKGPPRQSTTQFLLQDSSATSTGGSPSSSPRPY